MVIRNGGVNLLSQALPVSEAKARFSELVRKASSGLEVISANKHVSGNLVSLVRTDILTAALDALTFTLVETTDPDLGTITIAIEEIPVYGEALNREEAIGSLIDALADYSAVYLERIALFSHTDSARNQGLMLKILRCGDDRVSLRRALCL
ncbi:MAG: hypothetical protein DDT34_00477 [Firmicutes bacterium]|nr:hypothetical protein [Bacillota bacterium]MBT9157850.1 hypothetical protein [Bacillota bacterium]